MTDQELFERAGQQLVNQRSDFVRANCRDDQQFERVIELLRANDAADSLLDLPSTSDVQPASSLPAKEQIGNYKLIQKIGEGGMGSVYMAEQLRPVKRVVALKLVKAGMDSKQVIARFEAERQSLAMMDHPNIAKVLDAGSTDNGEPFFVMELVKGIPIHEYCDQNRLSTEQRVKLMVEVCGAVQHAHQKGIIHRDLKPSNILVAQYDDRPVPKVIDFGVAKATHQKLTDKTLYTQLGQIVGTLEYMSPEQAVLNQLDVDTRTDVYSLGVILYELLVGETPLNSKELRSQGLEQILRTIREQEPARPSLRFSSQGEAAAQTAAYRKTDQGSLSRSLRGDLDWIVMKALEKDRKRRYDSADRLAEDLQNYLDGNIVLARPPSVVYRLSKSWKRNKAATLTLSLMFLGLLGAAFGWYQSVRREEEAQRRLNIVQDFAMVLAMRGDSRDTEIAVNVCEMSGATEVWSDMLRAQSEMARGDKLSTAIDRLEHASRKDDPHQLSCLGLLAFAYILDGGSDRSRAIENRLRREEFLTPTEKIFCSNAFLSDPEKCWNLANEAFNQRESILTRFNRAQAASMQAMNANDLRIVRTGLEDLKRVREVVQETPNQAATRCQLYLAGQLILSSGDFPKGQSSEFANAWQLAGEELVSRLAGMPESSHAGYARAWYLDAFGSKDQSRDAWMDVFENGSNGWPEYHAAAMLYADNDFASARKYLQGEDTIEQLALVAVLSRDPTNHEECIKIYEDLKQRNLTAMFYGGFPLEILLDLGELDRLKQDASELLNDGNQRPAFDQLMLSYFAEPQKESQVLAQLEQFNRLDQTQGHTLIGRHMMAERRNDEAIAQFKKAKQLGVFNLGDYYWAKAYLTLLQDPGTVYVSNEVGEQGSQSNSGE